MLKSDNGNITISGTGALISVELQQMMTSFIESTARIAGSEKAMSAFDVIVSSAKEKAVMKDVDSGHEGSTDEALDALLDILKDIRGRKQR